MPRFPKALAAATLGLLVLGCSEGEEAYHISGTVTFKGTPIPTGRIQFTPDGSKGNSGQAGYAIIKDGKYDTSEPGGQGTVGGPMVISIEGQDPGAVSTDKESGEEVIQSLFLPYQTSAELAKEDTTWDHDVPADAADPKKANRPTTIVP